MMSKVYIDLPSQCDSQGFSRAREEAKLPGKKYFFSVPAPSDSEIRVAIAGDSVAMGCGATPKSEQESMPLETRLTDQTDGSVAGQYGWPYLLHELLRNNN